MKVSAERKRAFCDALVRGQTPEGAAKVIGVSRRSVYNWREADEAFAADWADAWDRKVEFVETALYQKAVEGEAWAICFFLKCHKPAIYNRRQVIAVGGDPDGAPVRVAGDVIHFFMPPNGRDEPEEGDEADEAHTVIDGTVRDVGDAEDAA